MKEIRNILAGALILGATSTLGDFIWELWIPRHQTHWGIIHGALLCFVLGAVLGRLVATWPVAWRAGLWETGVGLAAAGSFYLLWGFMGWSSMFVSWMLLWLLTALVLHRLTQSSETMKTVSGRGVTAALLSGAAFYLISGIWTEPPAGGPDYPINFISWTFAFLPGFAALLFRRQTPGETIRDAAG